VDSGVAISNTNIGINAGGGRQDNTYLYDGVNVGNPFFGDLYQDFAELDIAMATVAPSARHQLPLLSLVEHGVRVGLGEDGQRDYWSPYGNCDLLDRTWQLAFTNGFRRDDHIECGRTQNRSNDHGRN